MFNHREKQATGSLNYRKDIISTIVSINKGLLINTKTSSNDDW